MEWIRHIHGGLGVTLLSRHEGKLLVVKEIFASKLVTLIKSILTKTKFYIYIYIPKIKAKFIKESVTFY